MTTQNSKPGKVRDAVTARYGWALIGLSLALIPALYGLSFITLSSRSHQQHEVARAAEPADIREQSSDPLQTAGLEDICRGIARPSAHGLLTVPLPGATPRLFDTSAMPDINATCPHCNGPHDILFCCGVCVLEHRFCKQRWPGKGVSQRVLRELLQQGYPLAELTPCELFLRIRGRTLWFMGDSQTWHFYLAVECFLHEFALDFVRRNVTDDPEMRLLLRPVTVTKERYSLCLHLVEDTKVCVIRADDGWVMARDIFPTLRALRGPALTNDIMVYNFGLHFPPTPGILGVQLAHMADYVAANASWMPRMVWMDTPPQHFRSPSGLYGKEAVGKGCPPLENSAIAQKGGLYNQLARPYVNRLGQHHLETWNATVPFHYAHLNPDCTHFCSPGPYQLWTFLLNGLLRDKGLRNARVAGGGVRGEQQPAARQQREESEQQQQQQPGRRRQQQQQQQGDPPHPQRQRGPEGQHAQQQGPGGQQGQQQGQQGQLQQGPRGQQGQQQGMLSEGSGEISDGKRTAIGGAAQQ